MTTRGPSLLSCSSLFEKEPARSMEGAAVRGSSLSALCRRDQAMRSEKSCVAIVPSLFAAGRCTLDERRGIIANTVLWGVCEDRNT